MIPLLLVIAIIFLTIPTSYLLYKITSDEKEIYKKYFPSILWILAIATTIFITLNTIYALTTLTLFLIIIMWNNMDRIRNKLKYLFKKR